MTDGGTGQIITFYSYKGGTGRTMALANVACILAERQAKANGKGVLMIDWDLEAPGLHRYFRPYLKDRLATSADFKLFDAKPGLIDLFCELDKASMDLDRIAPEFEEPDKTSVLSTESERLARSLLEYVKPDSYVLETSIDSLYLLKAGRFDPTNPVTYSSRVTSFQWESFYRRCPIVFRCLAEQLADKYQYVLIDSRTGITDISGVTTMLMPDKLVVVFTPNFQSLQGGLDLIRQAAAYRRQSSDLRPLMIFPLVSRVEATEPILRERWRVGDSARDIVGYEPAFEKLLGEVYEREDISLQRYFDEIQIQHIPRYAYGEEIAVRVEKLDDKFSLRRSYTGFVDKLVYSNAPWEREEAESDRANLSALLAKVRQFWIEGVLEKIERSVDQLAPGAGLIDLRMQEANELVRSPVYPFVEEGETLPAGTKISRVFDSASHSLIILGEAGSGKTVTLLKLTRSLCVEAENDPDQSVPVVQNLSSWCDTKKPFLEWIVDELHTKYGMPRLTANEWIERKRLICLFDGLDEVNAANQEECVAAINHFIRSVGTAGIAVCCREDDYKRLTTRLTLNYAIRLLPLDESQVYDYLSNAGSRLLTLWQSDESLKALARSPLMLGVMIDAYRDRQLEFLPDGKDSSALNREHLFTAYADRVFARRLKQDQEYAEEETKRWLSWLASGILSSSQTEFFIQKLQPSWLNSRGQLFSYVLLSRLVGSMTVVLIGVMLMGLTQGVSALVRHSLAILPSSSNAMGGLLNVREGLWYWVLITGGLGGMTMAAVDYFRLEHSRTSTVRVEHSLAHQVIANLRSATFYVFICGTVFFLAASLRFDFTRSVYGGLIYGVAFGLIFWFRGRGQSIRSDIDDSADQKSWSWTGVQGGLGSGVVAGISLGLISGLVVAKYSGLASGRFVGELTFVSGLVMGIILGGLKSSDRVQERTSPNQGVKVWLKNTLLLSTGVGLLFAILFLSLAATLSGFSATAVDSGLFFGFVLGLLVGFSYGGLDAIYHYSLRSILVLQGFMPLNYVRFLNYSSELGFLRKVGGGYMFLHRSILEHFASLENSHKSSD